MQLNHATTSKMTRHEGMKLSLEVIVASLTNQSTLRYFILNEDITGWEYDPDKIVMELLEAPEYDIPVIARQNCIVHSTSWRFEPHQTIVLTYFVYSDFPMFRKQVGKMLPLQNTVISENNNPAKPRPVNITEEDVIAHGIRHISYLVKKGSHNMLRMLTPETIQAFQAIEGELAGKIN